MPGPPVAAGWTALLGHFGVAAAPRSRGVGELFGPTGPTSSAQVQRQEAPETAPPLGGACLAPDEVHADLVRIQQEATNIRLAVDPDGASPAVLDSTTGAAYTAQLRGLTHQTEVLRPVIDGCGERITRATLDHDFALAQDAVVRAYQTLAVHYADHALQVWSGASDEDKATQRAQLHKESGGLTLDKDWCGTFVDAEYREAGMSGALNMVFNSTFHVQQFFTYGTGSNNSPTKIVAHGKGKPIDLHAYHQARGSVRSWLARAAIGDDIRPGDVVTLDWLGGADDDPKSKDPEADVNKANLDLRADHICIVRSYTPPSGDRPGILITIDGNAYGAKQAGAALPKFDKTDPMAAKADATGSDLSTSQYQTGAGGYSTAAAQNDGPAFNRNQMVPDGVDVYKAMTLMGRGRPSVVDFEADHVYPNYTDRTDDEDGPGGPIRGQIQRREAGAPTADPSRAFDAATQGAAGELPYRAEMQERLGADFGGVQAYLGRDLSGLGAHAASRENTVVFASSSPDRETVAHELTHVVQHRQGRTGSTAMSDPGDASEHEARSVAAAAVSGAPVAIGGASAAPTAAIQRQDDQGKPPPAVTPPIASNDAGGGLNWDTYFNISMAKLPNGQSPNAIREIFNFYLLRHLREQLPDLCAQFGALPPESDRSLAAVDARASAVAGLGLLITEEGHRLRTEGKTGAIEALRVRLFVANQHAVVDALRVSTSPRYRPNPTDNTTFCNVYAYDVVTAMGGYLPRVWWTQRGLDALAAGATRVTDDEYKRRLADGDATNDNVYTNDIPFTAQVNANGLDAWLVEWGASYGWEPVKTPRRAQELANAGTIVVITASTGVADAPGHISVVLAETAQRPRPLESQTGGDYVPLQTQAGAQNFESNADNVEGIGQTGRSQWWTDPGFAHAGIWAYTGAARRTAVQSPELVGAKAPG